MFKKTLLWVIICVVIIIDIALLMTIFTPYPFVGFTKGTSMEPTLYGGDVLIFNPFADIQSGDVISFYCPVYELRIVHRIINVNGNVIYTQGDNNKFPDLPFRREDVRGKVVLIIPTGGR